MSNKPTSTELIEMLKVLGASIKDGPAGQYRHSIIDGIRANSAQWLIAETITKLEEKINDADLVLNIARHCENISKRGGDHAKEYHRIAQHLKKSAGHLKALERNEKTWHE